MMATMKSGTKKPSLSATGHVSLAHAVPLLRELKVTSPPDGGERVGASVGMGDCMSEAQHTDTSQGATDTGC